jgi:hypothetical protein
MEILISLSLALLMVSLLSCTPDDRSYRVLNLESSIVVESCDVTFDKTTPCPRDVFECAGDK